MIRFEAVDAGFGDCLLLRWTNDFGLASVMVVDGGPKSAPDGAKRFSPWRERLAPRLAEIRKELAGLPEDPLPGDPRLPLDLVVCTHVDDDHIAGIDGLYDCLANGAGCGAAGRDLTATRLWFNSFDAALGARPAPPPGTMVAASIAQGASLTRNALAVPGLRLNEGHDLIMAGQTYKTEFGPLAITILNPRQSELDELREEWEKFTRKRRQAGDLQAAELVTDVSPDQSIPNLSSIVMLVESSDGSLLLTGDQRSDYVLDSLTTNGMIRRNGKRHVNILKVPHHGSIRNNQNVFYDVVKADAYVFCAAGKDDNPDPPVLEMIAESRRGESYELVFTAPPGMAYAGAAAFQDGTRVATLQEALDHLRGKVSSDGATLLLDPAKVRCRHRAPRDLAIALTLQGGRLA